MSAKTALARTKTSEPTRAPGLARARQSRAVGAVLGRDRSDRADAAVRNPDDQDAKRPAANDERRADQEPKLPVQNQDQQNKDQPIRQPDDTRQPARQDLDKADSDARPAATHLVAPADGGVSLTLPDQPAAAPEPVAEVKAVELAGSSDQALLAYTDASPSSMALSQPALAPALDGKLNSEAKALADKPPELRAKAGGQTQLAMVSPDAPAQGVTFNPKDKPGADASRPLQADPHRDLARPRRTGKTTNCWSSAARAVFWVGSGPIFPAFSTASRPGTGG